MDKDAASKSTPSSIEPLGGPNVQNPNTAVLASVPAGDSALAQISNNPFFAAVSYNVQVLNM